MNTFERYNQRKLTIEERLERQSIPEPNTGCVLWTGLGDKNGYGKIYCVGRHWRVHVLAYTLKHGPVPPRHLIQHKCDTPACFNIDHLELGTPLTNMQDKVRKGRLKNQHQGITHCKHGHEFTNANTYWGISASGNKRRSCKTCTILNNKRRRTIAAPVAKSTGCRIGSRQNESTR